MENSEYRKVTLDQEKVTQLYNDFICMGDPGDEQAEMEYFVWDTSNCSDDEVLKLEVEGMSLEIDKTGRLSVEMDSKGRLLSTSITPASISSSTTTPVRRATVHLPRPINELEDFLFNFNRLQFVCDDGSLLSLGFLDKATLHTLDSKASFELLLTGVNSFMWTILATTKKCKGVIFNNTFYPMSSYTKEETESPNIDRLIIWSNI